jgi:hypothetical protein
MKKLSHEIKNELATLIHDHSPEAFDRFRETLFALKDPTNPLFALTKLYAPYTITQPLQTPFIKNYCRILEYALCNFIDDPYIYTHVQNSPVNAKGLYTTQNTAAGKIVGLFKGELLDATHNNNPLIQNYAHALFINHKQTPKFLVPSSQDFEEQAHDNAFFANDGLPNASLFSMGPFVLLISITTIPKGAEITFDYGPHHHCKADASTYQLSNNIKTITALSEKILATFTPEFYNHNDYIFAELQRNHTLKFTHLFEYLEQFLHNFYITYLVTKKHPFFTFITELIQKEPHLKNNPQKIARRYLSHKDLP